MHIGVDVGTSGTKTCAFDESGKLLAEATRDYDFARARDGMREIAAESFANAAIDTLREVAQKLGSHGRGAIRSITVASLGEAVVPVDGDGRALSNFITGTDRRGEEEALRFARSFGELTCTAATGVAPGGLYSFGKIQWVREHEPEVYGRAHMWLNVQDYVVRLLSGEAAMDHSIASRTMMYDVENRRWWKPALEALGLSEENLPRVYDAGTPVGTLRPDIAREVGIDASALVVVGAHDHIANTLGCGVTRAGGAVNATGTTEGITAVMDAPIPPEGIVRFNISSEPFAIPGMYCTVAWHNTAGVLLKWFQREFGRAEDGGFPDLDRKCPEGPTRLLILPHFSGGGTPDFDMRSKGAIVGLTLGTTRYDLFKALMEGATYELRRIVDAMELSNIGVRDLVVCGGGARSPVWMQMKSDILEREMRIPLSDHNGALGCSMLGAFACGRFESIHEAAAAMGGSRPIARPNAKNARVYAELMREYKKLYPALSPISHVL